MTREWKPLRAGTYKGTVVSADDGLSKINGVYFVHLTIQLDAHKRKVHSYSAGLVLKDMLKRFGLRTRWKRLIGRRVKAAVVIENIPSLDGDMLFNIVKRVEPYDE